MIALALSLFVQSAAASELKAEAEAGVDALREFTQQVVDQTFSYGELGFQEHLTAAYLGGILERHGFAVERGVAGMPSAWVASWGAGKPVIGFIADVDGIPQASQKPGVAYHDPLVKDAPGHGEGHNAGQAVNITAAIVLKSLMEKRRIPGTLRLYPGVAEELLAGKAHLVRAGLFKDVDVVLGSHVASEFATYWGQRNLGLVSVQYTFRGKAAHSAGAPWKGRSALDAVELMNAGWNFRREHVPPHTRLHYVIVDGGDQPNVVPPQATVWYFLRGKDGNEIRELREIGTRIAKGATLMTDTTVTERLVGSAWPTHFNRPVAEAQQKNIERVGMPSWSEADQALARALQKEIGVPVDGLRLKVTPLGPPKEPSAGTDDIGDISWVVPTVYLRYPSNIPNLPGHSWADGVAMATPLAHKGATAGAKVQALTAIDLLLSPELVASARAWFDDVQTKDLKYATFLGLDDKPPVELNREKRERWEPELRKYFFDPSKHKTYLEQLGIRYPTLR